MLVFTKISNLVLYLVLYSQRTISFKNFKHTLKFNFNKSIYSRVQMFSGSSKPLNFNNQVIILTGPTAVGKSAVAKELCKVLMNAEIILADSVQVS